MRPQRLFQAVHRVDDAVLNSRPFLLGRAVATTRLSVTDPTGPLSFQSLPTQWASEGVLHFGLVRFQLVENALVFRSGILAAVDIKLGCAIVHRHHVVQIQTANATASTDPSVFAWGYVGVQLVDLC